MSTESGTSERGPSLFRLRGHSGPAGFLVISPWAKEGFVDDTVTEPSSVLALIEEIHDLKCLTHRDCNASNLAQVFDFDQPATAPRDRS